MKLMNVSPIRIPMDFRVAQFPVPDEHSTSARDEAETEPLERDRASSVSSPVEITQSVLSKKYNLKKMSFRCRKAVRAAVVLLPLLGITNIISMGGAPLEKTVWFALWSYTTHFLTSFQGLFIATLYCFLNGEVNEFRQVDNFCMTLKNSEQPLNIDFASALDTVQSNAFYLVFIQR